jgi:hypothetical protein
VKNLYKINNLTIENLRNLGFRYSTLLSNDEEKIYIYRFPVYKYKNKTVLECELTVEINTNNIIVNVYNSHHEIYTPFYNVEYGNFEPILDIVNKNINKEFRKLGVERIKC